MAQVNTLASLVAEFVGLGMRSNMTVMVAFFSLSPGGLDREGYRHCDPGVAEGALNRKAPW